MIFANNIEGHWPCIRVNYSSFEGTSRYSASITTSELELFLFLGYFLGNKIPNINKYIVEITFFIIFVSIIPIIFEIFKKNNRHV